MLIGECNKFFATSSQGRVQRAGMQAKTGNERWRLKTLRESKYISHWMTRNQSKILGDFRLIFVCKEFYSPNSSFGASHWCWSATMPGYSHGRSLFVLLCHERKNFFYVTKCKDSWNPIEWARAREREGEREGWDKTRQFQSHFRFYRSFRVCALLSEKWSGPGAATANNK